jgi:proline iminopeptidase
MSMFFSRGFGAFTGALAMVMCASVEGADWHGGTIGYRSTLIPGVHEAVINGTRIHYEVRGQGPLVVIQAPAWGIGSTYLRNGLEPLTKHFTVLTFDPPGSGASGRPADQVPLNSREYIETLESLRKHWGLESVDLIGHSNGSALALGYAEIYPERVRKLVLIGSQVFGDSDPVAAKKFLEERRRDPRFQSAAELYAGNSPDTDEAFTQYIRGVAPYFLHDPDKHLAAFLQTVTTPLSAWPQHAQLPARKGSALNEPEEFKKVTAQTLIIEGREDPVCFVSVSQRMHGGIPGSQLIIYEHTGHFPWIEHREQFFADMLHFLKD